MKRTYIKDIVPETEVKLSGWIERIRNPKNMIFIVLKDITGQIQITIDKAANPEMTEKLSNVIANSVITVTGKAVLSEYVKMGGIEFFPTTLTVDSIADALPITKEASLDQRLNHRWIDLRDGNKSLIFRVNTTLEKGIRDYMISTGAIEIHTPKITIQSSEGGSEVFKLDYFGQPAYLTQSPQLYKQMAMASGFDKVFEIGDYFRAESSFTNRHATEFIGFDFEISHIESHHDVMDYLEGALRNALQAVKDAHSTELKETFDVEIDIPECDFPRIPFHEALDIVEKEYGYKGEKVDFDPESEKLICQYVKEKYNSDFVYITEYPFEARAFYSMKCEDNPKLCKSFDLLWKGIEITSGAQREHRYEVLKAQIAEKGIDPAIMNDYLEFFRYGCPTHGGIGLGIARMLAKLLNLPTIKEATYIFRGPNRITP